MTVFLVALAVAFADQLTKQVIRYTFYLGESRPIIDGFFHLTYVRNTGAAWGMFRDHGEVLIVVSVMMLGLMVLFRRSFLTGAWEHRMAFGLLVGGIVGNLMDRIRLQAVTDFLDFQVGGFVWPTFNIADSAICIGVGVYVLSSFWLPSHPLHDTGESEGSGHVEPAA
jgi:signal peptidase II